MKGVYLIHFDRPYKHAAHYLGYSGNIADRVLAHHCGEGSRLLQVIEGAGIGWDVVKVWEGASRTFERQLKNRHGAGRFCPVCKQREGK